MEIAIFTENQNFGFNDVSGLQVREDSLEFDYIPIDDEGERMEEIRHATFDRRHIIGWSHT